MSLSDLAEWSSSCHRAALPRRRWHARGTWIGPTGPRPSGQHGGGASRDDGFALVGVLAILILAAAVLATLTLTSTEAYLGALADHRRATDEMLLLGMARLSAAHALESPGELPAEITCRGDDADIAVGIVDHAGLIDLNAASPNLLILGFAALGLEPSASTDLAGAVVAFRIQEASPRPLAIDVAHGLKHSAFEAVEELSDFAPLRDVEGARLASVFTVLSATGTLRYDSAPPALRRAVDLAGARSQPFIFAGPSRRPALTVNVTRRPFDTTYGAPHSLALVVVPDPRRPGGFRTASVYPHVPADRPKPAQGACPAYIQAALSPSFRVDQLRQ